MGRSRVRCVGLGLAVMAIAVRASNVISPYLVGYNDVLGPAIQVEYNAAAVTASVNLIRLGALRSPGGTVANLWNMTTGNYSQACIANTTHYESECTSFLPSLDQFPPGTFAAGSLRDASSYLWQSVAPPVWDLNVMYADLAGIQQQLDYLAREVGADLVRVVELGNEFYLTNSWGWWFPNATSYADKMKASGVYSRAHAAFPGVEVVAVASSVQTLGAGCGGTWNEELAASAAAGKWFDGVTIHDYAMDFGFMNATYHGANESSWASVIMAFGGAYVQNVVENIATCFGDEVSIHQTEFNYAGGGGAGFGPVYTPPLLPTWQGLHGLFHVSRIIAALSLPSPTPFHTLLFHALFNYPPVPWDGNQTACIILPINTSDVSGIVVSARAQLFAHAAHLLLPAASPAPTPTPSSSYLFATYISAADPSLVVPFSVLGRTQLPCVCGIQVFDSASSTTSVGVIALNRCAERGVLSTEPLHLAWNATLQTTYFANDTGSWAPAPPQPWSPPPWSSGPLTPVIRDNVPCPANTCAIEVPPLSAVFVQAPR